MTSSGSRRDAGFDRTQTAVLEGAARCFARVGVRGTTMQDVAHEAGVAKGTLYNHVRTKPDLLRALVVHRVRSMTRAACELSAQEGLGAALRLVCEQLVTDQALVAVREREPEQLLPLLAPWSGAGWDEARAGCAAVLSADHRSSGEDAVGVVLRQVLQAVLWPREPGEDTDVVAEVLARRDVAAGYLAQ